MKKGTPAKFCINLAGVTFFLWEFSKINSNLSFSRNYEKLRPYTDYCEEVISIETI